MALMLNEEQRQAVEHINGPLLALAGAGSGKTRVITERIAYLIKHGVLPSQILAVTFTNKAAAEMRERITKLLKEKPKQLVVSTFHSFCVRVLKGDIEKLGYKNNFSIYSSSDSRTLIRNILREIKINTLNYDENLFAWYIDRYKNNLMKPYEVEPHDDLEKIAKRVYEVYQTYLKGYNAVDFNDLINLTIDLYVEFPEVLEKYQERFRYIMVDEYQDTNFAQYKLTSLLASKYRNIAVVGDDDQSIYAFRGADVSNMLSFENEYPDAKIVTLTKNYRSTKAILEAAHSVISNNIQRKNKEVVAEGEEGIPPVIMPCEDEREEAQFVADSIINYSISKRLNYEDFAVLFRMNAQSRLFEEAFRLRGLPYTVVGAFQFYERKEIKDILAYLNLFVNPEDEVSLLRVINIPKRGIGAVAINTLNEISIKNESSLYQTLLDYESIEEISPKAKAGIKDFLEIIEHYHNLFTVDKNDIECPKLYENINKFLDVIAYHNEVLNSSDTKEQGAKKMENVESLMNGILEYEKSNKNATLKNYLDRILLMSIEEQNEDEDKKKGIMLMSIHAAKGLEFPYVYICGMEDGIMPHQKSLDENGLEEERRLCYVAMTRAKKHLTLTYCRSRTKMGRKVECTPSVFLEEMSKNLPEEMAMNEEEFFSNLKASLRPDNTK
ncbi:ATP-dependent helicase [uncultured Brachyspira sp.]|uniref:ATP-dependent helicase n=1 Tax=uncultured Brachyspira sp. TaxID=221953 RepID=UPI00260AC64C|nr:UvrD-helicase domain-containing protein [uncultured Brachyspira sp.]